MEFSSKAIYLLFTFIPFRSSQNDRIYLSVVLVQVVVLVYTVVHYRHILSKILLYKSHQHKKKILVLFYLVIKKNVNKIHTGLHQLIRQLNQNLFFKNRLKIWTWKRKTMMMMIWDHFGKSRRQIFDFVFVICFVK